MEYIVKANNLVKKFGDLVAVNGISFVIQEGECFGILGPNGAGKTSTIRMIYGFSPMDAGTLTVFGYDIRTNASRIKSRIGVCQQENSLDPDLTVKENLEIFAGYFSWLYSGDSDGFQQPDKVGNDHTGRRFRTSSGSSRNYGFKINIRQKERRK